MEKISIFGHKKPDTDSVTSAITLSYLKNSLGESKLFIFNTCVNLIREIKAYRWGKGDSPVKVDDHSMDELRYYIMNRPENKKPKEDLSIIQKEKERLIRNLKYKR